MHTDIQILTLHLIGICFHSNISLHNIDNNADVSIGQNCAVGYNVVFITSNHSIRCNDRRGGIITYPY